MITKQHRGYDQSVVQTVIVSPMTIAGPLMLVQNSLALAFALGGIVAAIRFRNTLRDTKDVVYVYLALGVGMSAGVFVPVVSAAMSLVFNYTLLTLWHFNVGNIYAHQTLTGPPPGAAARSDEDARCPARDRGRVPLVARPEERITGRDR